jgi:integral membrane protein
MDRTLKGLRIISLFEGASYLILLVATIVKRTAENEVGVQIMGPVHGVLFLVFAYMILVAHNELGWRFSRAVMAIVLGVLPFGAFWLERSWLREGRSSAR